MSRDDELAAVKRKIRALTAKTVEAGASEAEAEAAMVKVGKLLTTFNLTLNEALLKDQTFLTKSIEYDTLQSFVATYMARFTDTKVWKTSGRGKKLNFFGIETDVDLALYLMSIIKSAYNRSYQEFKASEAYLNYDRHRRTLQANFMAGFYSSVNIKLANQYRARKAEEKRAAEFHAENMKDKMLTASDEAQMKVAESTTGTALMLIDKEKTVNEEFSRLGMKLRASHSYSHARYDAAARSAGNAAGSKVNLSRPIKGRGSFAGYLK